MTGNDIIRASLRLIGVLAAGENPSAGEQSDALSSFNRMLGSWSANGLLINRYTREVFQLIAGQNTYTIGEDADFDTVRPSKIAEVKATTPTVVVTEISPFTPGDPLADPPTEDIPAVYETEIFANIELPVAILNIQEWSEIPDKNLQSNFIQKIYVQGASPLDEINVWPTPSEATGIVLYSHKPLTAIASGATELGLPPGYDEAFVYNLAVRLAPEFGKSVLPEVYQMALELKADLMRANSQPVYMISDAYGLNRNRAYEWRSGG